RLRGLLKKGESRFEPVNLVDLVRSTLSLLHSELVIRNVRTDVQADEAPPVTGDAVQLQQVILNLLMNAMEAMCAVSPSQRRISVAVRLAKQGFVEVSVTDRGRGIAPEHHALVLQPFFTTKENGLGLGLTICSTIVKSHGGELRIENVEGGARA